MNDLGLHKGIMISLAGTRSCAGTAAQSLGIDVWGPAELRHHLGETVFADVAGPAPTPRGPGRLVTGWPFQVDPDRAHQRAVEASKGRFGLRSLETVTWFAPLWLPAYLLQLSVAQPHGGRLRNRVVSTTTACIYDGLEGGFLHRVTGPPTELPVGEATVLKAVRREAQIHAPLRKAVEARQKVASPAATERHNANLVSMGLPVPIHSVSIDHTSLVHLPVYVALLRHEQERVVAINGETGTVSERLSRCSRAYSPTSVDRSHAEPSGRHALLDSAALGLRDRSWGCLPSLLGPGPDPS